jgi:hypothetical protein
MQLQTSSFVTTVTAWQSQCPKIIKLTCRKSCRKSTPYKAGSLELKLETCHRYFGHFSQLATVAAVGWNICLEHIQLKPLFLKAPKIFSDQHMIMFAGLKSLIVSGVALTVASWQVQAHSHSNFITPTRNYRTTVCFLFRATACFMLPCYQASWQDSESQVLLEGISYLHIETDSVCYIQSITIMRSCCSVTAGDSVGSTGSTWLIRDSSHVHVILF